jgi:hypothetical protein
MTHFVNSTKHGPGRPPHFAGEPSPSPRRARKGPVHLLLVAALACLVLAQVLGIVGLRIRPRADLTFNLLVGLLVVAAVGLAAVGVPKLLRGG